MKFKEWMKINEADNNCPDWDTLDYKYSIDSHGDARIDFFDKINGAVGFIVWNIDDGEVERIYVGDKCRRKGLGTYIWNTATEYSEKNGLASPEHSSKRSYLGDVFAKSIGGRIPRLTDDIDGWSTNQ